MFVGRRQPACYFANGVKKDVGADGVTLLVVKGIVEVGNGGLTGLVPPDGVDRDNPLLPVHPLNAG